MRAAWLRTTQGRFKSAALEVDDASEIRSSDGESFVGCCGLASLMQLVLSFILVD